MPVSADEFKRAMRHLASGVSVVTAQCEDRPAGITVTAFSALSLQPPLVLVCIDQRAWLHDRLTLGTSFAVNLLAANQEAHSRRFAKRGDQQFDGVEWSPGVTGAPVLGSVLAAIECTVVELLQGGDHTIVVGQVEAATVGDGQPLVHFRGNYARLA